MKKIFINLIRFILILGLKSQLIARLAKAIKVESHQDNAGENEMMEMDENEPEVDVDASAVITIDDLNNDENIKKTVSV